MAGVSAALLLSGFFQYHWMLQSAQAERERQTRVLAVSMIQAVRAVLPLLPPDIPAAGALPSGPAEWQNHLAGDFRNSPFTGTASPILTGMIFFPAPGTPVRYRESPEGWEALEEAPEDWEPVIRRLFEAVPDEPGAAVLLLHSPGGENMSFLPEDSALLGSTLPGGDRVVYFLNQNVLLTQEIIPSLRAVLPDYDITWSREAPSFPAGENRRFAEESERDRRFSPGKALFPPSGGETMTFELRGDLVFRKSSQDRGIPPFIGAFRPPFQDAETPPEGIYLTLVPRGLSLIREAERRLALNWIFSVLLLAGIGAAFFLVLVQGRRLRLQRMKEREFVASVTHELRTPLTVIRSAAQNLRAGIVPESRRRKYGELIEEQAQRLARMVEGILLYSGLEGKRKAPPVRTGVEREALRHYLRDRIPPDPEAGGPSREVLFDWGGLPPSFPADGEGLELILGNLLANALIHTDPEDGPVKIKGRTRLPGQLVFTVEDHGPGLPSREQKKLFTPFFRGSRSRENQIPGSGLGLYLSRRRASLAGGSLTLESPYAREDGKMRRGCRFTLIMPFGEAMDV